MPILITKTYATITEESAEFGDYDETGIIEEDIPYTFRELVREMVNYPHVSQSPNDGNKHVWLTNYGEMDYRTGDTREESIHYSSSNPQRNAKYWRKAMKAAGYISKGY